MTNETKFGERTSITGELTCEYNGVERRIAYPPVQGTYQDCFKAINGDARLIPAEGLDLALIMEGAYTQSDVAWKDVKDKCFVQRYARNPIRLLWMPSVKGSISNVRGVFLERDFKGEGLSTKINLPDMQSGWEEKDGIYVHTQTGIRYIPADKYKLGEHTPESFVKDALVKAQLTPEGAEIVAKVAKDNKKTPWSWGVDLNSISNPEQRVSALSEYYFSGLDVLGSNGGSGRLGFAFGVFRASTEGAKPAQKN